MKKFCFYLLLFFSTANVMAQSSISSLESQLKSATDKKQKMMLNYKLSDAYLAKSDYDKAISYAKRTYDYAADYGDNVMLAESAFLHGLSWYRRGDESRASTQFRYAYNAAKSSKRSDLIIKTSKLYAEAVYKGNRKSTKPYSILKEAIDVLKNAAPATTAAPSSSNTSTTKYTSNAPTATSDADKRKLVAEKQKLEREIEALSKEKEELYNVANKYKAKEEEYDKIRSETERSLSEKELALASSEEAKAAAEARSARKEKELSKLTEKEKLQRLLIKEQDLAIAEERLKVSKSENFRNILLLISGFILALAGLFYSRYRSKKKANESLEEKNKIIEDERQRSDELLLNILPGPIAQELKENGKAKAQKYENATVLFADFKNFSSISEKLSPEALVNELDYCFKAFDFIISQYKIEKIKTIGDAYMCASGLSDRISLPDNVVKASLEIQEFLQDYKQEKIAKGEPFFEARIGIHTGPVVAGVVGVNKFAYDIWGDTVNIAARMEANSEVGRVNISDTTYRQIKYAFDCTHRGKIAAKNKGMIDMYFVNKATA